MNWFHILPKGHYDALDRDFARALRNNDATLLGAFIMADVNLLARDIELDLLALRGFIRAKYGMRSEAVAQLLGIDSAAQLLIKMNAWVRTKQMLQALTFPGPPTSLGIHIPRISSRFGLRLPLPLYTRHLSNPCHGLILHLAISTDR